MTPDRHSLELRFVRSLDARDAPGIASLFESNGVLEAPKGSARGVSEIEGYYRKRFEQVGMAQHMVTCMSDEATEPGVRHSFWYLMTLLEQADGEYVMSFGDYDFVIAVHDDGTERIRRLRVRNDHTFALVRKELP